MDLRTLQAQWLLDRVSPERVHELATALLSAGLDSPALRELAGAFEGVSHAEIAPVLERAFDEAGLRPMPREAALWRLAYTAAEQIVAGTLAPRDGATALWSLANELGLPEPLRAFVYLGADYGEGPGERRSEEAWFDTEIRASAQDLLARMPSSREAPPEQAA